MKFFKLKTSLPFGIVVIAAASFCLFSPQSSVVYASAAADTKAKKYCEEDVSGAGALSKQSIAACQRGFVAGYDGTNEASACNRYEGDRKKLCNSAFDKGRTAKIQVYVNAGREGAQAKKSKSQACSGLSGDGKKSCEKAYDKEIITMAQNDGKKAGADGASSPCDSLGYGGNAAKEACKTAYNKGQIEAGRKPRGTCGTGDNAVSTYFDFTAICAGTDTKAGGNKSPIIAIGLAVVGWITALVAVAVVGGVIYGGFLYLTARDNTGQTEKGITVITNSVVALIAWGVAYALINFLVPGGLFNG